MVTRFKSAKAIALAGPDRLNAGSATKGPRCAISRRPDAPSSSHRTGSAPPRIRLAAQVAVRMMQDGGNAVDAGIAAAVLLGICEPQSTGIGGDCFVLVKPPGEERVVGLNGSGRAPAGLDAGMLRAAGHATMPTHEAAAVTVPGAVDAFVRLSADWGRLGLAASLAPAIRYAEEGVPVAPRAALDWQEAAALLKGDARRFYLSGGQAPTPGEVFRAPRQAEVLRRIAREGRAGFYAGEVARGYGRLAARAGRRAYAGGFRRRCLRLCRADQRGLPRARTRGVAAERPGRDGDPDGERSSGISTSACSIRSARRGRISRPRRRSSPMTRAIASSPIPTRRRTASGIC